MKKKNNCGIKCLKQRKEKENFKKRRIFQDKNKNILKMISPKQTMKTFIMCVYQLFNLIP